MVRSSLSFFVKISPLFFFLFHCSEEMSESDSLKGPEILYIHSEPPALIPPGEVTCTVFVFDPYREVEKIYWYLPVTGSVYDLSGWLSQLNKRNRESSEGFLFLGEGSSVKIFLPRIPPSVVGGDLFVDTLPLPILTAVHLKGGRVLKGVKRLRAIIPEGVVKVLRDELGRDPFPEEITYAVRVRMNQNPVISSLSIFRAPDQGEYEDSALEDLKVRNELPTFPLTDPVLPPPSLFAVRFSPSLTDPDLFLRVPYGKPGFQYLTVEYRSRRGSFYPLSLTSADFLPVRIVRKGRFSSRKIESIPRGIYTVYGIVLDHQGGVTGFTVDLDFASIPFTAPSFLLKQKFRLLWVYDPLKRFFPLKGDEVVVPVTFTVDRNFPPFHIHPEIWFGEGGEEIDLDRLEWDPFYLSTLSPPVKIRGKIVRTVP